MSYNWENIKWQSKNGLWSIGFFEREPMVSSFNQDDDYDSEWEDDFDRSKFSFASVGHATPESADNSWKGANPGSSTSIPYSKKNAEEISEYEDMAKAYLDPAYARQRAEKIARAAKAAVRRRVRDEIRQQPPLRGGRYNVSIGNNGISRGYTGTMKQEGDWLGFDLAKTLKSGRPGKARFVRMWNVKTENIGTDILSISRDHSRRGYGW